MSLPTLRDVQYEKCRRSYGYYVAFTHKQIYIDSRFSQFITQLVQKFVEKPTNNAYEILCLSVPPQHGKSMHITETLPSWLLGKFPKSRTILASYNDVFAKKFMRKNRNKLKYHNIFNIKVSKDSAETVETELGSILSAGLMGGITGNPADFFIVDDPIKNREEARSETIRNKIFDEWNDSIKSRLSPGAKIIVIQTRWHKEDLIGKILQTEKNVIYVNLPVIALNENDPMGRQIGESLCPEIGRTVAWWNDFKIGYENQEGSETINSLYYGNPTNVEGGLFKREWFTKSLYTVAPRIMHTVISVDATFKDTSKSDYVAIQVWGKSNVDYYLLDKIKKRMSFTDTVRAIEDMIRLYPNYDEIDIEDKANGSAIIDVLRKKYASVIPITPKESKEARASAISPMIEAGNVHLLKEHYTLIDEATDFPNSDHDDEVDCMSQALNRLRNVFAEIPHEVENDLLSYDDEINEIINFS